MKNKLWRWSLISFGWLCVALGTVGILLPVLPTTPFMLLAAACFAKSSPRFHRWLLANPVFGPIIINWQQERYIEPVAKRRSLIIITLTYGISIYLLDQIYARISLIILWMICTYFVARLPTVPLSLRRNTMAVRKG